MAWPAIGIPFVIQLRAGQTDSYFELKVKATCTSGCERGGVRGGAAMESGI